MRDVWSRVGLSIRRFDRHIECNPDQFIKQPRLRADFAAGARIELMKIEQYERSHRT